MPITIYGIKNCDTMKEAFAFLDKYKVAYAFFDYRTAGIERASHGPVCYCALPASVEILSFVAPA